MAVGAAVIGAPGRALKRFKDLRRMSGVPFHVKTKRTAVTTAPDRGRPRLEDVAAAVGLSAASVSLVLRGAPGPSAATRERVLEAAARPRHPRHPAPRPLAPRRRPAPR